MAYSELVKNLDQIRDYIRQFYVYGFKSRSEYTQKSIRSYDNERRRIESWLDDYMKFRQSEEGKIMFLSVDSRSIPHNPLYRVFRAKSFTSGDIIFHFCVLDMLQCGKWLTVTEIADRISLQYCKWLPDLSTLRKKLKEYVALGILKSEKRGQESVFARNESTIDEKSWADPVAFFSEEDPMGVVGSFLLNRLTSVPDYFQFKHHYILHAVDSQILMQLLQAISEQRRIKLMNASARGHSTKEHVVLPVKIFVSTQGGRQYLLCYHYGFGKPMFFRLDYILSVIPDETEVDYTMYENFCRKFQTHAWGVSEGVEFNVDHLEMTICYGPQERHILRRLEREKRNGRIERLGPNTCRYVTDVYDARELLPWIRTFTGRIVDLKCTDPAIEEQFYADLREIIKLYGGDQ